MAKEKKGVPPVGGGSRAAKKRRKQKQKPVSTSTTTSSKAGGAPLASDNQANTDVGLVSNSKGKAKQQFQAQGSSRHASSGDTAAAAVAAIGGGSTSKRSQAPSASEQASVPTVIDASKADDRSRLLMELDAHGVLADPDVESGLKARQLLQWIVAPLPVEEFYDSYWEKNAFVVRGRDSDYFHGWLDTSDIESFVSGQSMQYGSDLDVTNYVNKRRITLNPSPPSQPTLGGAQNSGSGKRLAGKSGANEAHDVDDADTKPAGGAGAIVTPKYVWEKFREGCSLRMPCPQKFSDPLHQLLASLEEEFGCMVGSNVYLTPPRSQGFAPHWDDIEAFLLQVEGKKRWRVYRPSEEAALLPRLSSPNLTDEQVGEPVLEVVLEPGDLLYFPRGWAHQAETVGDEPSLHITVSAMQANCWGDLIEGLIPQAVASAIQSSQALRGGLPRDYLNYMGVVHSDETADPRRDDFRKRVESHLGIVMKEALQLLDAAADQMGKRYISDRLPPVLEAEEEAATVMGRGETPITPLTKLRMVRRGCARLILEDGVGVVYHCMDNARVHHGSSLSPLEFELDDAPAIEALLAAYPDPVRVADLPHPPTDDLEDKLGVATALYKEGFLLIVEDDEDNDTHDAVAETSEVGSGAASRRDENESGDGEDSEGEGL